MKILMACMCLITSTCFSEIDDIKQQIQWKINSIDLCLDEYEFQGEEYSINFDYHVGFMNGKIKAYKECLDIINQ